MEKKKIDRIKLYNIILNYFTKHYIILYCIIIIFCFFV